MDKRLTSTARGLKALLVVFALIRAWFCFYYLPFIEGVLWVKTSPEFARFYWPVVLWIWCYALPRGVADIGLYRVLGAFGAGRFFEAGTTRILRRVGITALITTFVCLLYAFVLAFLGAGQPGIMLTVLIMSLVGVGFFLGMRALALLAGEGK